MHQLLLPCVCSLLARGADAASRVAWLPVRATPVTRSPRADPAATPEVLHLLRLAPPRWFSDGRRLRFDGLPTVFGPVALELHSRIDEGVVRGRIQVGSAAGPRRDYLPLRKVVLWLHSPDGAAIRGARFDGEPLTGVHETSIELPADRGGEFEITF